MKRPNRQPDTAGAPPTPIEPTAIPPVDPDSVDAMAFSMRGRNTGSEVGEGRGASLRAQPDPATPLPPFAATDSERRDIDAELRDSSDPVDCGEIAAQGLISIKLPPDVGRQLAAIADRRGSKRTLIAIEALSEPLRALATAHRAGDFPELPKVVSGTVRSSIAFALPPDLAADLDFILKARRAVRAQVVTRLLAPAVRALYDSEVGRRSQ